MLNDLIGLQYKWGAHPMDGSGFTDCFALSMEVRRMLGLHDFYPEFKWVYDLYEEEEVGGLQVLKWIWAKSERIKQPRAGALFRASSFSGSIALATVVSDDRAIMIGPGKRVIALPFANVVKGKFHWAK
jgi:hypothetical protein